jgi:hypothetical protein
MQRSIELRPDTKVILGRETAIFARFKLKTASEMSREKVSFSIVNSKKEDRTLDLEGQNENEVEIFISQLRTVIQMFKTKEE